MRSGWSFSIPRRGLRFKDRPCLVISPDEMNRYLRTVIVAPMTTVTRPYPTRVSVRFQGKRGQVALDQLRAVDRQRLVRMLGAVSAKTAQDVSRDAAGNVCADIKGPKLQASAWEVASMAESQTNGLFGLLAMREKLTVEEYDPGLLELQWRPVNGRTVP